MTAICAFEPFEATSRADVKRTLRIAALTSHLVLIVKSPQFERSDPGDRLFMRWQSLRLVDRLGSNLTDGWPGAEQQTRVPVKNGCGRKQCRRETSGVCQATILRTAIATWFARAFSQRPPRSPLGRPRANVTCRWSSISTRAIITASRWTA